ncbi:MAG: hypothetical protein CO146_01605 [Candidatus Nealsonbacteria bacterium CG_4_9_14_3_um_filter_37_29]|uniref:Homing endonuclease LAGLIDADG domain-containing protein n=1 Tax=Candidatus Nealsonbacteria bacterium CG_4_9_14_3_um_filter_37_29 TaxID=1974696 RepID=A0A2M7Z3F5_9BACT|nr:MAG: hypothetical protein CO146_01605 [Candidatus Nealsonbacteria bacterium CG_4_9_14_3_um_filter_37_29]
MRSREIEEYKSKLSLSERQKEILIGLILGDGHLEKLYTPTLGRLKVEHSYKQKDYVDWLYEEFRNWVRSKPKSKRKKVWNKTYLNYGFLTYGHRMLGEFQERFYRNRKKIVPKELEKDITSLGLAIWFMDDGSIKSRRHKGLFLNTQDFKKSDVQKLQQILKKKFDLSSSTRQDEKGEQIYLGGKSAEKFIGIIKSYIIPSMEYKIPRALKLTKLPKR